MANRLASATSPYLLQHADNPVDWWEWGAGGVRGGAAPQRAGAAQRRVRRVPLVPRHGARVVRGRGDRGVHERALRQHQGRPRGAARRRRGLHAGDHRDDRARRLADDLRARPRRQPVLRRHLLPRPAAARPAVVPPGAAGDRRGLGEHARRGTPRRRAAPRAPAAAGERSSPACSTTQCWTPPCDPGAGSSTRSRPGSGRAEVPAVDGARVPAAASRRGPGGARRMLDATLRGDGPRRHLRPARRRVRALLRRPRLGGAALREDALRQRAAARALRPVGRADGGAGRRRDRRLHAPRAAHRPRAGSPPRWTPTARASRASSTPGRRPQLADVLGEEDGAWAAGCSRSPRRARSSTAPPPCSCCADPDDRTSGTPTSGPGCSPPASTRVRPARDDKVVAAWNGLAISGLCDAGLLLGRHEYVARRGRGRASCWPGCTVDADGRLLRVSRDGVAGRHAGCWRTTAASPRASSPSLQATGDAGLADARARACSTTALDRLPRGRRRLPRHRRRRRGAGRPAAGPVRQRQPVRAVGDGARARRRTPRSPGRAATAQAAEEALGHGPRAGRAGAALRRLVAGGRRRRCSTVRSRWPSSGPAGPDRDALERAAPGGSRVRSWSWPTDGRDDIPLLVGRSPVDGRPAAYVCRNLVCERPVTDPDDLAG